MNNFNLHPLLVHFPIAFLSLYCVLELLRFKKLCNSKLYFGLKAFLVIAGTILIAPTLLSGKIIEDAFSNLYTLVELHSHVAYYTFLTFSAISAAYVIRSIEEYFIAPQSLMDNRLYKILLFLSNVGILQILFAVLGLVLISLTGVLGGIIAFGPNVDPLTKLIFGYIKPLL